MSTCLSICRDVPENGDMLNPQHRRGRYIKRHIRLGRWCFPRWQQNEGRPDIQASLSPLCTSLFPVSEEQEARKKKQKNICIMVCSLQATTASKTWETHQWGSDSSFIQSGRGDDHLSSAALVLSSPCRLACVFLSDWHKECVLFHLHPLKLSARCVSAFYLCRLHAWRFRWVCGGAASVSAEVHQHVRLLSVQLWWRISTSSRSDLLHRCVCVCVVVLFYYISVCECLLHLWAKCFRLHHSPSFQMWTSACCLPL